VSASRGSTPARPGTVISGMTYVASPLLVTEKLPGIVPAGTVIGPSAPPGTLGAATLRIRQVLGPTVVAGGWLGALRHPIGVSTQRRNSTSGTKAPEAHRATIWSAPALAFLRTVPPLRVLPARRVCARDG
jgi:hypothetical protein